ncbi:unnamed protein product [marine sediment metagenome]|uniref:DNA (cytosine-5-)-methyltransferase n=1 Tax=marine sediment metagenome TaxID=412755 RepID=X1PPF5_9ZZZZ
MVSSKVILDLFGATGAWSEHYRKNGYDVRIITLPGYDVRLYASFGDVYGVLAAPPCTDLAGSGARWWEEKGFERLFDALARVDAAMRIILMSNPHFWCLENPVGRLVHYLGKPKMYFNPCDYGDPWTKKTCLWGNFNIPKKNPVVPIQGSKMHLMPPSKERAALRSITPPGFAKAFYEANP